MQVSIVGSEMCIRDRYGSNFLILTLNFLLFRRVAREAEAIPFPRDDATPPVIKTKCITEYRDT